MDFHGSLSFVTRPPQGIHQSFNVMSGKKVNWLEKPTCAPICRIHWIIVRKIPNAFEILMRTSAYPYYWLINPWQNWEKMWPLWENSWGVFRRVPPDDSFEFLLLRVVMWIPHQPMSLCHNQNSVFLFDQLSGTNQVSFHFALFEFPLNSAIFLKLKTAWILLFEPNNEFRFWRWQKTPRWLM